MVTGLLLLLACVGLFVVVFWMNANDGIGAEEPTHGLLAMPHPERPDGGPDKRRKAP